MSALLLFCASLHAKSHFFSPEVLALLQENHAYEHAEPFPVIVPPAVAPKPPRADYALLFDTLDRFVDIAALAYAGYSIFLRHQQMNIVPVPQTYFQRLTAALYPQTITSMSSRARFCYDAGGIVVETLLYKTLAKLILMCGRSDAPDIFEKVVVRIKRLIKLLVWS